MSRKSNFNRDSIKVWKNIEKNTRPQSKIIFIIGFVVMIASFIITCITFSKELIHPKPTLDFQNISLDYWDKESDSDEYFITLMDDISMDNPLYYINEMCATKLLIKNSDDKELLITNFEFYATNIQPIDSSYINHVWFVPRGDGISMQLHYKNTPLHLHNVTIKIKDTKNILSEYIDNSKLEIHLPDLYVNSNEFEIFNINDFIKIPTEQMTTVPYVTISADEIDRSYTLPPSIGNELVIEVNRLDLFNGESGDGVNSYGIFIDTSKKSYKFEDNTSFYVSPGEIFGLPICFAPNKSCTLEFYIQLTVKDVYGKTYLVKSKPRTIQFDISKWQKSCFLDIQKIDYQKYEFGHAEEGRWGFVSYPFSEKNITYKQWLDSFGYYNIKN